MDLDTLYSMDELSLQVIIVNLVVALLLSLVLKYHFERFSATLSGKKELASILPFLVLIICLIISVVKSSLALSLGLVGALSIVRFRTPIKEPEELVYLFMAIAIGLGLGANQTVLTIVASGFILTAVAILKKRLGNQQSQNLYISIKWQSQNDDASLMEEISQIIADNSILCNLKRLDRAADNRQLSFLVDLNKTSDAFSLVEAINKKHPDVNVTFIDHSRIPGI